MDLHTMVEEIHGYLGHNSGRPTKEKFQFKSPAFHVVQQVLGKVVWSDPAPTVSGAEKPNIVHTRPVVDMNMKSLLSNTWFSILITEAVGKILDSTVNRALVAPPSEVIDKIVQLWVAQQATS